MIAVRLRRDRLNEDRRRIPVDPPLPILVVPTPSGKSLREIELDRTQLLGLIYDATGTLLALDRLDRLDGSGS